MSYSIQEFAPGRCPESKPNADKVDDEEVVARVLHSGNCHEGLPNEMTFQTDHMLLIAAKKGAQLADCECGQSDGVSVLRTPPADNQTLRERVESSPPSRIE